MKNLTLTILTVLLLSTTATFAQMEKTDKEAKEAITKLSFIVGDWAGTGWMMGPDGQKHRFEQTENISFKLDSTAILIEGIGKTDGKITHNALAIVTFIKDDESYKFSSYLSTGRSGDFKGELIDGKFYWYPNETMRYIIYLNDQGQWYETGEMKRGKEWFQFFEMTLDKK